MTDGDRNNDAEVLQELVGDWEMEVDAPWTEGPTRGGTVSFEWMPGERFLIQRWEVPVPEAPDGLAVIGWDEGRGALLQHYFDSRGVARVYEMKLDDGVWTLERTREDLSPLEFAQRYEGRLSDDGSRIDGAWEIAHDKTTYEKDFDLSYIKKG
ncbi:MAG: hypothetical protein ACRDKH_06975 [Solirubrobacterales bacterium]